MLALYTQSTLLTNIRNRLRDNAAAAKRWTDAEIYQAMNDTLLTWSNRVQVPYLYTLADGFTVGTSEYSLPDYIDGPVDVEALQTVWGWTILNAGESESVWREVHSHQVVPSAAGGQTLRINQTTDSTSGQIIWWGRNGPVPDAEALPITSAELSATATSVTLTTKPVVGRSGFIKIGAEWMQYAGLAEGATTITLSNLVRGVNGSTAAVHATGATVNWIVAMHDEDLLRALYDETLANLHSLFLVNGSSTETQTHERAIGMFQQRLASFWGRYVPARPPKLVLDPRAKFTTNSQFMHRRSRSVW